MTPPTRQVAVVVVSAPLATAGGILALFIRETHWCIPAGIAFLIVVGLTIANGMLMVLPLDRLWRGAHPTTDAVVSAAMKRLGWILVINGGVILTTLPMAFATGAGSEFQRPLATVLIGSMISSAAVTLLVVPTLYKLLDNLWG